MARESRLVGLFVSGELNGRKPLGSMPAIAAAAADR
jgi:hypothetical protein